MFRKLELLLLTVILAACSGGDSTEPSTSAATTTSTSVPVAETDKSGCLGVEEIVEQFGMGELEFVPHDLNLEIECTYNEPDDNLGPSIQSRGAVRDNAEEIWRHLKSQYQRCDRGCPGDKDPQSQEYDSYDSQDSAMFVATDVDYLQEGIGEYYWISTHFAAKREQDLICIALVVNPGRKNTPPASKLEETTWLLEQSCDAA